jgi:glycerol uptake facilitator protein
MQRSAAQPEGPQDIPEGQTKETRRETHQPTTPEPTSTRTQRIAGEFLGTCLLVLFHAGMTASRRMLDARAGLPASPPDVLFLALGQGLALFAIIMIVGKVSGALINPAVTLGLASAGRLRMSNVLPYLTAQFAGAVLGAALIVLLFGPSASRIGRVGSLSPLPGMPWWQAMAVEAAGAFILLLAISATAEDPRAPGRWAPLAIGMTLAAIVALFEPLTGAGVNPARAFGPDLVYAIFFHGPVDWVIYLVAYLLGPVMGAIAAVWLYRFLANQPKAEPLPE